MSRVDEIRRRWAGHGPWHVDGRSWLVDADGNDLAEFERYGDDEYWQGIAGACASAPEDVAHLLGEVERLTKVLERARLQAGVLCERVDAGWLPERFANSARGQDFCLLVGHMRACLDEAKAGKAAP